MRIKTNLLIVVHPPSAVIFSPLRTVMMYPFGSRQRPSGIGLRWPSASRRNTFVPTNWTVLPRHRLNLQARNAWEMRCSWWRCGSARHSLNLRDHHRFAPNVDVASGQGVRPAANFEFKRTSLVMRVRTSSSINDEVPCHSAALDHS